MFHVQDGLYFERTPEGRVLIRKTTTGHADAPVLFEQVVDADAWASVVATVSAFGETSMTFDMARWFQTGFPGR